MGAPKQKWTAEEEAALKAGVGKYGVGKWRSILLDPDFSGILHLRSNVDLKDKWRNIKVMANGWGSRSKARLAIKSRQPNSKNDDNTLALSTALQNEDEIVDAKPLAVSGGKLRTSGSKEQIARLDNLIFEAITRLKEPSGSDKATIAMYIEEQYCSPTNLKKLLSAKLNLLTENGKLIKVKRRYRMAPSSAIPEMTQMRKSSSPLLLEERQQSSRAEKSDINVLSKPQIDAELAKMRSMTAQEAAAAAARAVAEAEAAIAEAEEAARAAEEAEAEAEAAQVFAKAAMKALKCSKLH